MFPSVTFPLRFRQRLRYASVGVSDNISRESVDVAFGDVAFQICENGVFKEKNVRLNSAGCEPHSRSDECFLFENPIFTLLKRHVRKRHVYRLPNLSVVQYRISQYLAV